jgi:Domain of Unknown Function (DUF928)
MIKFWTKLGTKLGIGGLSLLLFSEIIGLTGLAGQGKYPVNPHVAVAASRRKPLYRRTAGRRSGMLATGDLMVFLPEAGKPIVPDISSTATPTLYFNLPLPADSIRAAYLQLDYVKLVDRRANAPIPAMTIVQLQTPGMLKIQLPELARGKPYRWQLSLRYQVAGQPLEIMNFEGVVVYEDLPPALQAKLAQVRFPNQQAAIYLAENRWLDAVPLFLEDPLLQEKSFEEMIEAIGLAAPPPQT